MPKIQKIVMSDDFECDGCKFEYNDRTTRPCSKCNRNYELYSDRYQLSNELKGEDVDDCDDFDTEECPFELTDEDYEEDIDESFFAVD